MIVIDASALAGRRFGGLTPFGASAACAASGYAEAGPSSLTEDCARRPLGHGAGLGSTGNRTRTAGRVGVWMAGDLSPKDWNQPDSRTPRAADLETN